MTRDTAIVIGISSCLLGEPVRYDGRHKHASWVTDRLSPYVTLVPFCPEVAIGLGVPRPPIELVDRGGDLRAVGVRDPRRDVTDALLAYGEQVAARQPLLSGFILKQGSPSCGVAGVRVRGGGRGSGRFAHALGMACPLLPMVTEGPLEDRALSAHFIARVRVYHRWQALLAGPVTHDALLAFHQRHQLLVMAHSQAAWRRLGGLLSRHGPQMSRGLIEGYGTDLMAALARQVRRAGHLAVMTHLLGYLGEVGERAELVAALADYGAGRVPRSVPMALFHHYFDRHPHPRVAGQVYVDPAAPENLLDR